MSDRTRIDDYRGRKDSALALHYLWRVGEAMVTRRDRFERVYALTEAVAPPSALREVDDAEADDVLALKAVAAAGLTRLNGVKVAYVYGHKATPAEESDWRDRWLSDGSLVEVKVEGWRATQVAPGTDANLIADLEAGRVPEAWPPIETTTEEETTFLSPLDPVSARGRAKPLFGFDYVWEVYKPARSARSATTRCRSCGATGWSGGSTRSWTGRPARSSSSACGWRTRHWPGTRPSRTRWRPGCGGS